MYVSVAACMLNRFCFVGACVNFTSCKIEEIGVANVPKKRFPFLVFSYFLANDYNFTAN